MADESTSNDPVQKFRKLIASFIPLPRAKTQDVSPEKAEEIKASPQPTQSNFIAALPKKLEKKSASPPAPTEQKPKPKSTFAPIVVASKPKPEPESIPAPAPPKKIAAALPKRESKPKPTSELKQQPSAAETKVPAWGPRLWTTASAITLGANILLIIILIILIISVYRLKLDTAKLMNVGVSVVDLPAGLYSNFEKMERANIETNVVVDAIIPVKFDLELNQQTNVVLSQDVTIMNALVTVNTGGLNITRANTTIVLPAGTTLPVNLALTVPVDKQVPVTLNVPVNIPLKETQLNDPFVGLQNVIKPLYCLLNPKAVNMDGAPICQ